MTERSRVRIIGISGKIGHGKSTAAQMAQELLLATRETVCVVAERSFAGPLKESLRILYPELTNHDLYTQEGKLGPVPGRSRIVQICPAYHPDEIGAMANFVAQCINWHDRTKEQKTEMWDLLCSVLNMTREDLADKLLSALVRVSEEIEGETIKSIGQALQQFGTEHIRNNVHKDFWMALQEVSILCLEQELLLRTPATHMVLIYSDLRFQNEFGWIGSRQGLRLRIVRPDTAATEALTGGPTSRSTGHISETALDGATFDAVILNNSTLDRLREKVGQVLPQWL